MTAARRSSRSPRPSDSPAEAAALRRQAERHLVSRRPKKNPARPDTDEHRLVHELQVHQVELELQNVELRDARDRTEELLEKYTDLYDFSPVGHFSLSADGRIKLVNLTGASLLRVARGQLIDQLLGNRIRAEQRVEFAAFLQRVFSNETRQSCEVTLLTPGFPPRTVHLEARRLDDAPECRAVMRDVTERRHAEEQLRLSERRYRRLFEAANDGVLLLDPVTGKITDANPFMTRLLSYPRDRMIGKELSALGLPKDEAASREMLRELKQRHEIRYEDLPLVNRHGRVQEVEVVANLYQENGHAVIQCNIRDITQRKLAEGLLRRNEALFYTLLEQAPVGVYVVDDQFRLTQINPRAQPLFGKIHPLMGRNFREVIRLLWPRPLAARVLARFQRTLRTGKAYQSPEFTQRRQDNDVDEVYEWQIQRITLPDGDHGVVCFFNDITERKKAELARRRLDALASANREANKELVQRRAVEQTLRESEQVQFGLLAESRAMHIQMRHLTHQIITAQEEERKKISRELHDDVMQTLVGINTALGALNQQAAADPEVLKQKIARTQLIVKNTLAALHRFARELRPAVLDDFGLIPALQIYCKALSARKNFRIRLKAPDDLTALDNNRQTVLFRVAQEALTNVARHARASQVEVRFSVIPGAVRMEVQDNGQSFRVQTTLAAGKYHRLGLLGMRERVEMVGGTLVIESSRREGTLVRAEIPFRPTELSEIQEVRSKLPGR